MWTTRLGRVCKRLGMLVPIFFAARIGAAQTGVFAGVVTSDSLGHAVTRAEIALPELQRTTIANERGEFRFGDVPTGHYAVTVRAIGFQVFTSTIDVVAGQTLDGELMLLPTVAQLDSVRTTARATPRVPPQLQEFEARQKARMSGYFLTDSMLRRREQDNLASMIAMLPGVSVQTAPQGVFLGSSHGGNTVGPIFETGGGGHGCYFTVYLDGQKIYTSRRPHRPNRLFEAARRGFLRRRGLHERTVDADAVFHDRRELWRDLALVQTRASHCGRSALVARCK